MGWKFSIICGLFELLLMTLFATLVRYGDYASPQDKYSKNKSSEDPEKDVPIYYPSKCYVQFVLFA